MCTMANENNGTNIVWKDDDYDYTGGFAIDKRGEELFVMCSMECGFCRLEFSLTKALREIENGKYDNENKNNQNKE